MIIVMKPENSKEATQKVADKIKDMGLKPVCMEGTERTVIAVIGDERLLEKLHLDGDPAIESVSPVLTPYKTVSREAHKADSIIDVGGVKIGGGFFGVIAGPCSVESRESFLETADAVKKYGANFLRGGAYKPRTSPYSFQGLGEEGLIILEEAYQKTGMPAISEVVEAVDVPVMEKHINAFQVGARNMQNFRLLQALGRAKKPVILKRGMAATLEELLLAAEYIVSEGNPSVILCERGIRTYETATRNTLDLNAVPYLKQHSHLPVIVDPSHGTGVRELVIPMSKAAIAAGADGIMVEVHHNPAEAMSDGAQSLFPHEFERLMTEIKGYLELEGKTLA